jgi:hypothetical protein
MPNRKDLKTLGPQIKTYAGRGVAGADFCLWVIPGLLIPAGFAMAGLFLTVNGYTQTGFSAAGRPWLWLARILLLPFAVLAFRRFQSIHTGIAVHKHGLHLVRISGKSVRLGWDEITGIHTYGTRRELFGKPVSDRYGLTIAAAGGRSYRIPDTIAGLDSLAATIRAQIAPHVTAGIKASLARGERVFFGPVTLDGAGMAVGKRSWPWREIDRLRIAGGDLVIESGRNRFSFPVEDVPNTPLLLEIAARYGSGRPGNHEP